jgi:hypothetical protein
MNRKNVVTLQTCSRKTRTCKKLIFGPKKALLMLRKMPKTTSYMGLSLWGLGKMYS